jgi:hypothetical protein
MKHIKLFEDFDDFGTDRDLIHEIESFLENYITDQLTDVYGSMSYSTPNMDKQEGEYGLDSEISGRKITVWADLYLTPEMFAEENNLIEKDYKKFAKKFEDAVEAKDKGWSASILTRPEENVLILQIEA